MGNCDTIIGVHSSFFLVGDNMNIKKIILQFTKFSFVGVICTVLDYLLLAVLHEVVGIDELVSSAIAFSLSVIVNYLLSMQFVFKSEIESRRREFIIFVTLSIIGLILNQILMYIGVRLLDIHYLIFKVAATFIVLIYNFFTRKIFIEKSI